MSKEVTVSLSISGHFYTGSFPEWITHRANLLSLCGWVKMLDENHITVQVCGDQVLVDAFEAACSLGPMEVVVESIEVQPQITDYAFGSFRIL